MNTQHFNFGEFLRERRRQIPNPRGKAVTQEELAEAVGVSRAWYAKLECGVAERLSPQLFRRLAFVLGLTPQEHAIALQLAFPELQHCDGE